jgi:hypothetical protein
LGVIPRIRELLVKDALPTSVILADTADATLARRLALVAIDLELDRLASPLGPVQWLAHPLGTVKYDLFNLRRIEVVSSEHLGHG